MSFKFAAMVLSLFPTLSFATHSKQFAACYGHHHGSYLSLTSITGSEGLAQIYVAVSTDADESEVPTRYFIVEEVTKNAAKLQLNAYSWAIRQSIKAIANGEYYGFVKVKSRDDKGVLLYMNLQSFLGADSLVIDGTTEPLTCPLARVQD